MIDACDLTAQEHLVRVLALRVSQETHEEELAAVKGCLNFGIFELGAKMEDVDNVAVALFTTEEQDVTFKDDS